MIQLLKQQLSKAQNRMKQYADKRRSERVFEVGDSVFLRARRYQNTSLSDKIASKLAVKYFGPYKVIEKIGNVAYKLQLPPESHIHPVFHVSLLKKSIGSTSTVRSTIPALPEEDFLPAEPIAILDRRLVK